MRLRTGTTEWNRSYNTGNSLSALHSSQQFHDDTVSTSVHPLVSTQEINGTTSSGSAFGPQVPRGPISSPVLAGPTRNVTGEAIPTSLAEAVTQLSFLEFLQRCNLLIASPQPLQLPVPISLLDAAVQTTPPCDASQDVSTQTSDQSPRYLLTWQCRRFSTVSVHHPWTLPCRRSHTVLFLRKFLRRWVLAQLPRFLLTWLFRLLYAVLYYTILPHNYRPRSSLLDVSFRTILLIVRARYRHKAILVVSHRLNLLTLLRLALSAIPALTVTITSALWLHVSCCSHHRVSNSMPRLQVSLLMPTCAPHMAYLLKRHHCDPGYVQLSQSRPHSLLLVPSMWEHILCGQLLPTREVQVSCWREPTILSVQILEQGLDLFPNREPSFFLWSNFGNPNLTGLVTLVQATAISCITNTVSLFFSGIQARRSGTPPISLRRLVEGSTRLFFKKPEIMFRTSPISSLRILVTRTSLSCSIGTPLSPTLLFSPSRKTPHAKVRGVCSHSSFEACCDALHFLEHRRIHHIHNVVAKKRDASIELLQRLYGYMREHNVEFIGGDFNMSVFSTVGDVFTDAEFSAPGNSFLWGLGALEEPNCECAGFLIMPKRPYVACAFTWLLQV